MAVTDVDTRNSTQFHRLSVEKDAIEFKTYRSMSYPSTPTLHQGIVWTTQTSTWTQSRRTHPRMGVDRPNIPCWRWSISPIMDDVRLLSICCLTWFEGMVHGVVVHTSAYIFSVEPLCLGTISNRTKMEWLLWSSLYSNSDSARAVL